MFENKKIEGLAVIVIASAIAYFGVMFIQAYPLKPVFDKEMAAQVEMELIQSEVK